MERPPGRAVALHPSCQHKYLALQEQLLASPSTAGTGNRREPTASGKGEAEKGVRLPRPFSG